MKKLMLLLFLWLAAMALAACAGDGGKLVTVQTEDSAAPVVAETPVSANLAKLERATGTFTISQGGVVISPYESQLWSDTYAADGWINEDAMPMPLAELAGKLPEVELDASLRFQMSENAELRAVEVFDHGYERIHYLRTENEFWALIGELNAGTYYVVVNVGYTGKYIREEDKYNTSCYLYMFKLTVGE